MTAESAAGPQVALPPTPVTELLLTRHGETVWHHDNRYAGGSSDIDLTDHGRSQARALAAWSRTQGIDAVYSSPVRRARETAAPVAEALGLPVTTVEGLREVDFGVAEGRTIGELLELDAQVVHRFRTDPVVHPFPGSEPPHHAADRAAQAVRDISAQQAGGRVLVVAHNTLLRLALCQLLGIPVSRYRQVFPRLENTAITRVLVSQDPQAITSLLSLNVGIGGP
jgi:broad specificity phosphatase PhoE